RNILTFRLTVQIWRCFHSQKGQQRKTARCNVHQNFAYGARRFRGTPPIAFRRESLRQCKQLLFSKVKFRKVLAPESCKVCAQGRTSCCCVHSTVSVKKESEIRELTLSGDYTHKPRGRRQSETPFPQTA